MKMFKYILVGILLISIRLSGCTEKPEAPYDITTAASGLDSLTGTWVRETRTGQAFEQWKKVSDSLWVGVAWRVKEGDSTLMENLRIFIKDNNLYYAPTVPDQNDGGEILFVRVASESGYVFENKAHDFPNRIIYTFPSAGEMKVIVEDNSGKKRILFNFYRLKHD